VSDLHATPVRLERLRDIASKRFLAWVSWRIRRSRRHRPAVLEALLDDLRLQGPDHVAVTGDLTNSGGEREFRAALGWLEQLGGTQRVSLVPGNHDATLRAPRERSWDLWSPYLGSDSDLLAPFPSLRLRGPLAIVGLCSAVPTRPFLATGQVGAEQLERLEKLLLDLADTTLCRVVLVHHPPLRGTVSARRGLRDGDALCRVLERAGADLVLHGHAHRSHRGSLAGREGAIPVVGVRSASYVGDESTPSEKTAQYHLYDIDREVSDGARPRFRVSVSTRSYLPETGRFADGPVHSFG